jgi:hypothetical protein
MNENHRSTRAAPVKPAGLENRAKMIALVVTRGTGAICSYCHRRIDETAIEYEVEASVLTTIRKMHFHRLCHHLWESMTPD